MSTSAWAEQVQEPRQAERAGGTYLDGIAAAIAIHVLVSFGLGILFGIVLVAMDQELTIDQEGWLVALELVALVVAVIGGMRFAELSGWRAWVLVIGGAVLGWVALVLIMETIGESAIFGALGGSIGWLVWRRSNR